jgi:hypothetical protein
MIRNYSHVLVSIIAAIGLVLAPTMYLLGSSTVKATTSTTPTILPLVQNGNTQNHFIIDKSQFKKVIL